MDFSLSPELERLRRRVVDFVDRELLPLEEDPASFGEGEHMASPVLGRMRDRVRAAGLWCPQMPVVRGGLGQDPVGMAVLYEELGRSRFGPVSFNCAAPDDGNMYVLEKVGTEEQKRRWLQPIVDGAVRSSIVMTEPAPRLGFGPRRDDADPGRKALRSLRCARP